MERFPAASALIGAWKPDRPVIGLRPHAAGQAARWFLQHFPGDVAYAYKANSSVFLLGALYGAGIRKFDVASKRNKVLKFLSDRNIKDHRILFLPCSRIS